MLKYKVGQLLKIKNSEIEGDADEEYIYHSDVLVYIYEIATTKTGYTYYYTIEYIEKYNRWAWNQPYRHDYLEEDLEVVPVENNPEVFRDMVSKFFLEDEKYGIKW